MPEASDAVQDKLWCICEFRAPEGCTCLKRALDRYQQCLAILLMVTHKHAVYDR